MQRQHRFFSRALLTLLVVMLGPLALHAYTLHRQAEAAQALAYGQVTNRSAKTAEEVEWVFARAERLLTLLASRDALQSLDPARCQPTLRGMATLDPLYTNVAVTDMTGLVICSAASAPPGAERRPPMRMSGPRWHAAVKADRLHLSEPLRNGPMLGRPVAVLTLPMRNDDGVTIGLVGISLDLLVMAERVFAPGLPAGGSITLVNASSTVLTRHPSALQWIGTSLPRSVRDARDDHPNRVVEVAGPDGVSRAYATTPLRQHGLRLAAGIPTAVIFAEARAAQQRSYGVAALTLLAALAVAFHAARWLSAPLQSLGRTARAWAQGERETRADESLPGEFKVLAQEFNRMIDAREASEARLRESERRYAEMLDGVDMLAVTLTQEGLLSYCNNAVLRLTGWQRGEVIGQSWARHFLPPDSPELKSYLHDQAAGDDHPARSEGHIVTRSGQRRLIRWAHTPLHSPEGALIGRSSIGEDITERREVELARQASAEAAAANQAKNDFLARMSHELRTPLNAVLGFSQLLQNSLGNRLTDTEKRQLQMIFVGGEQLNALVEDILDVSRIETGRLAVDAAEVELGGLLDGVLRMSESAAGPAGVRLVSAYAGQMPLTLRTDPVRLRQVLLNLVSNGIKYNRPGGHVTVDVTPQAGRLSIAIADDGLGMTPQQLQTLCEPFNRLGREHTSITGSGIGMALSRELVLLLSGEMSVTSTEGQGTLVHVSLPFTPASSGAARAATPSTEAVDTDTAQHTTDTSEPPAPTGRVLYIEDNPTNAVLVEQLLSRWPGVMLTIAEDGTSGVRQAQALRPDLVLLDMQLPDIDGIRVLELLRESPATRDLRVVVLSASAMPAEVEKARSSGALDYWTKPIDFMPFLRAVAALLNHKPAKPASSAKPEPNTGD